LTLLKERQLNLHFAELLPRVIVPSMEPDEATEESRERDALSPIAYTCENGTSHIIQQVLEYVTKQHQEAMEEIKSLKEQINMLTQSDTKFYASETDRQHEETEKRKKLDDLTSENKALIQRNEVCRSQLEEAANINESLQQLLEEKERKLDRLQIEHSTLITANLQNKKLVNEVEKYKSAYEKVEHFELENNKLKKERDEQKSKLEELEQKFKISEKQKRTFRWYAKEYNFTRK